MKYIIDTENLSQPALETMIHTINLSRQAHMTNVDMRINGENKIFEADWIKYLEPISHE